MPALVLNRMFYTPRNTKMQARSLRSYGCGAKEFRCRLKERQPVVAKAHQSPVPKGLGHAFRCAEAPRAGYNSDAAEHFSGPASKKFS